MEKLKYILDVAKGTIKDLDSERIYIETKLHYFMYVWLAIVISICTLFGKTINIFYQYITIESYLLFFGFQFLSILIITYLFFKVWHYNGNYLIITDIKSYISYYKSNDSLENLMQADLEAQNKSIENNSKLNNIRNRNLNWLKLLFKYYLCLLVLLTTIIFILN